MNDFKDYEDLEAENLRLDKAFQAIELELTRRDLQEFKCREALKAIEGELSSDLHIGANRARYKQLCEETVLIAREALKEDATISKMETDDPYELNEKESEELEELMSAVRGKQRVAAIMAKCAIALRQSKTISQSDFNVIWAFATTVASQLEKIKKEKQCNK